MLRVCSSNWGYRGRLGGFWTFKEVLTIATLRGECRYGPGNEPERHRESKVLQGSEPEGTEKERKPPCFQRVRRKKRKRENAGTRENKALLPLRPTGDSNGGVRQGCSQKGSPHDSSTHWKKSQCAPFFPGVQVEQLRYFLSRLFATRRTFPMCGPNFTSELSTQWWQSSPSSTEGAKVFLGVNSPHFPAENQQNEGDVDPDMCFASLLKIVRPEFEEARAAYG